MLRKFRLSAIAGILFIVATQLPAKAEQPPNLANLRTESERWKFVAKNVDKFLGMNDTQLFQLCGKPQSLQSSNPKYKEYCWLVAYEKKAAGNSSPDAIILTVTCQEHRVREYSIQTLVKFN